MKYIFITTLLTVACVSAAFAQKREAVQLGGRYNDVTTIMSKKTQYLLPEFTKGAVFFKSGESAPAMLNYNLLLGQMQFMQDTSVMEIANVDQVTFVSIGKMFFYKYKKIFIQVLVDGNVQLGVSRKLRIVDHRKEGGYGGTTSLMNVETVSSMDGAPSDHLTGNEELMFEEDKTFYIIKDGKPVVANKKAFIKAFPKCKDEIEKNRKMMDYSKEEQLRALVILCQGIE